MKIAFIGGGNMANAMITGILKKNEIKAENICVTDRNIGKLKDFEKHGISIAQDNQIAVNFADYIFLTIKPQQYKEVITKLKNTKNKVFITVAPSISIKSVEKLCKAKIIRTMPNTPALVGEGVTTICRSNNVNDNEYDYIKKVLSSFSTVYEINEAQMNDAVALTGSSPAYAYMFIEAIASHSAKCGIDYNTAIKMAAQTLIGSAKMIIESGELPLTLCDKVCSKGGTTIKAVEKLNELNFADTIAKAMTACVVRAKEIENQLS